MSKQKSIDHSTKRSFHLIFQVGNSAFLRSPPFFPVVGSVEVSGNFIDRLIKAPRGQNQTLKVQGGSAPFFRHSPSGRSRRFFRAKIRLPPLTLSPLNTLPAGKKKFLQALNQQESQLFNSQPEGMCKTMNIGIDHGYYAIKTRHFLGLCTSTGHPDRYHRLFP